jgi:hypothetical protein
MLHLHGTPPRPVYAVEHDQQGVATRLDDPASVFLDGRVYEVPTESAQPFERPLVV